MKRIGMVAWFVGAMLLAGALRLPRLEERPMHCDEAINADKSGALLEKGTYQYDPNGFHGPTLNYLTLIPAWIHGVHRYADMDERMLRLVPSAFGILLVAAAWLLVPFVGFEAAAVAALLAAVSPAMVYYSRYYIHEVLLVFFSFGVLLGFCAYRKNPSFRWALITGVFAGMAFATKETAILVFAAIACAHVLNRFFERRRVGNHGSSGSGHPRWVALGIAAGAAVAAVLYSSFFTHPRGIIDSILTYRSYFQMAGTDPLHIHPWHFYLDLLVFFRADSGPIWSESVILVLGAIGFAAAMRGKWNPDADVGAMRFLGIYAVILFLLYSAIPYKTPWCILGAMHGMILLAGIGAAYLLRRARHSGMRLAAMAFFVAAAAHLGWEAWAAAFPFRSDPRNPYVYAHTSEDVFGIAARVEGIARSHPAGASMPVQVFTKENLWPLPWYFRRLAGVRWSNAVPEHVPSAPLILITPDMEAALARKLYELPPPGERELYMNIFEQPVHLRPGVEVRGYAAKTVWDEYLIRAAAVPLGGHPKAGK